MKEGESGDYFCLLADGQVKVTKQGKLLNVLHAGECFGEMAYLQKEGQRSGRGRHRDERRQDHLRAHRASWTRPPTSAATSSTAPSWRSWSSA